MWNCRILLSFKDVWRRHHSNKVKTGNHNSTLPRSSSENLGKAVRSPGRLTDRSGCVSSATSKTQPVTFWATDSFLQVFSIQVGWRKKTRRDFPTFSQTQDANLCFVVQDGSSVMRNVSVCLCVAQKKKKQAMKREQQRDAQLPPPAVQITTIHNPACSCPLAVKPVAQQPSFYGHSKQSAGKYVV